MRLSRVLATVRLSFVGHSVVSCPCLFFFFFVFRRPPSSTLFPYTTLFRSCLDSRGRRIGVRVRHLVWRGARPRGGGERPQHQEARLVRAPFMVGTPAHVPPVNHHAQLVQLIAEGRTGDAVKFYMKDVIVMPGLLVTVFRFLPMWSKLKAVAKSLPYDSAVMGDFSLPTRRAASLKM